MLLTEVKKEIKYISIIIRYKFVIFSYFYIWLFEIIVSGCPWKISIGVV